MFRGGKIYLFVLLFHIIFWRGPIFFACMCVCLCERINFPALLHTIDVKFLPKYVILVQDMSLLLNESFFLCSKKGKAKVRFVVGGCLQSFIINELSRCNSLEGGRLFGRRRRSGKTQFARGHQCLIRSFESGGKANQMGLRWVQEGAGWWICFQSFLSCFTGMNLVSLLEMEY